MKMTLHFCRIGRPAHIKKVTVTADNPRAAWAIFDALYPFKYFTAPHRVERNEHD
jgi:hypothetical protein